MSRVVRNSSSQKCHSFGGALPAVSKTVSELCLEISKAKEICTDRESAEELRDLALSIATIERVLESPLNARTDVGGWRSLLDLLEDCLHSTAKTLHDMCEMKRHSRYQWMSWVLMPLIASATTFLIRWSRNNLWVPHPRTILDSSIIMLWNSYKYVLTKRRTGLIVVSLFVWSNIRPSVFYKKKIEYLKLLHQRLFLLLRLCQLVRSISEYTNELHAIDPSIFSLADDPSWDERLVKISNQDHLDEIKPPARLLLEKVPMTHTAGFWYSRTWRFRLIITGLQITYASVSFSSKFPNILKLPAMAFGSLYYGLRPGEAAFCMSELMSRPTFELVEKVWELIDSPIGHAYSFFASPRFQVERTFEIKRSNSPLSIRFRVISLDYVPDELLDYIEKCQQKTLEDLISLQEEEHPILAKLPVIYHIHGGGFIGDFYPSDRPVIGQILKRAPALMISVSYALAPRHQYPAGLNDCFDLYKLLVKGCLGISPSSTVLIGDSAGGNLCAAVTLKAIDNNVKIPDGIVTAYAVMGITTTPSPSRVVFMPDLLVPLNMLTLCQKCYIPEGCDGSTDYYLSPLVAPSGVLAKFPPMGMIVGQWDPFCDDSCDFAARLASNKVMHRLKVYDNLPHGFLNLVNALPEVPACVDYMASMIDDLLQRRHWAKSGVIH